MSQDLQHISALLKESEETRRLRNEAIELVKENRLLWRWVVFLSVVILLLVGALTDWRIPFAGGM